MNTIEQIVKNESLDDIVTIFSLFKATPHLEMMIGQYKPESIRHGELQESYSRLFESGVLAKGENSLAVKGPNWKAPEFFKEIDTPDTP
ncbi:hypothetical protein SAMN04490202_1702 [Pseudomonas reinekei]|jgi:hypothetical protein|uniref:Immunity protein n=1 Tax=Pseudomonas reinekei TaxID=395598 RepID=A0A1H0M0M6_PSERE|nr:hypothetical protein [Pseudomonas reinekei]KAB0484705.1 hypothetical protein F7R15_15430 [Pseudomonas reinekei]OLU01514.1 hypothetical protein BVK86_17335 [Pseudomonas reinekei]SDO73740.1 hypothetical protein SAMN04490202_1702 [Pseudomonas reinekei]